MKKILTIYGFFLTFGLSVNANSQTIDNYLKSCNLFEAYQKKARFLQDEKIFNGDLSKLDKSIRLTMSNSLNKEYKVSYLHDLIDKFPYNAFKAETEFATKYAVRYDPLGSIDYLESAANRDLSQNFQLMILWQIYQPEKVATPLYRHMAQENHEELRAYFKAGKWQAGWREKSMLKKSAKIIRLVMRI